MLAKLKKPCHRGTPAGDTDSGPASGSGILESGAAPARSRNPTSRRAARRSQRTPGLHQMATVLSFRFTDATARGDVFIRPRHRRRDDGTMCWQKSSATRRGLVHNAPKGASSNLDRAHPASVGLFRYGPHGIRSCRRLRSSHEVEIRRPGADTGLLKKLGFSGADDRSIRQGISPDGRARRGRGDVELLPIRVEAHRPRAASLKYSARRGESASDIEIIIATHLPILFGGSPGRSELRAQS